MKLLAPEGGASVAGQLAPAVTVAATEPTGSLGHDLRAAVSEIIRGLRMIDESTVDFATRDQLARVGAASGRLAYLLGVDEPTLAETSADHAAPAPSDTHALPVLSLRLNNLSQHHIVVADPDETRQALLADMLRALGAALVSTRDDAQLARVLAGDAFDLVIVGTGAQAAPGPVAGLDLILGLNRGTIGPGGVPVLAVTGQDLPTGAREAILRAGANALLAMPEACIAHFGQVVAQTARKIGDDALPASALPPGSVFFDEDRLSQLLEIAGPIVARDLLARLRADLANVRQGLLAGLDEGDTLVLRGQTHVLIALAGAVGAQRLQHLAEALNAAANSGAAEPVRALGRQTLYLMDHLIHFVGEQTKLYCGATDGMAPDDSHRIVVTATAQEMR